MVGCSSGSNLDKQQVWVENRDAFASLSALHPAIECIVLVTATTSVILHQHQNSASSAFQCGLKTGSDSGFHCQSGNADASSLWTEELTGFQLLLQADSQC